MGPIELALLLLIVSFVYLRYKDSTLEYSLKRRDKMILKVGEIIENPDYSNELKAISLGVFHVSVYRNFLPAIVWHLIVVTIKYKTLGFIFNDDKREDIAVISKLSKTERKIYVELIGKHLIPINVINAPHWYILFGFIFLLYLLLFSFYKLGSSGKAHIRTIIETAIISKICNSH